MSRHVKMTSLYLQKMSKSKCIFNTDMISYIGYIASSVGIEPDTSKFNPIMLCPDPTNVKELQFLQYYSRFVKGFAELASPLYDLCKKDIKLWKVQVERALPQACCQVV